MANYIHGHNMAVFTTKNVVLNLRPIVIVYHDIDGSWQFFSKYDKPESENAMIVSLGQIIDIDESILELTDMPSGYKAFRESEDQPWNIEEYKD